MEESWKGCCVISLFVCLLVMEGDLPAWLLLFIGILFEGFLSFLSFFSFLFFSFLLGGGIVLFILSSSDWFSPLDEMGWEKPLLWCEDRTNSCR